MEFSRFILGTAVQLFRVQSQRDGRGSLHPLEFSGLPFLPQRAFLAQVCEAGAQRGGHAHKRCQQLLISLVDAVDVEVHYLAEKAVVRLDLVDQALFIAPLVWSRQTFVSASSQLLVFASEPYDATDYVNQEDAVPPPCGGA